MGVAVGKAVGEGVSAGVGEGVIGADVAVLVGVGLDGVTTWTFLSIGLVDCTPSRLVVTISTWTG